MSDIIAFSFEYIFFSGFSGFSAAVFFRTRNRNVLIFSTGNIFRLFLFRAAIVFLFLRDFCLTCGDFFVYRLEFKDPYVCVCGMSL